MVGVEFNLQKQIDDTETCIDKDMQRIAEEIDRDGNNLVELAQQEVSQIIDEARRQVERTIKEAVSRAEDESIKYMRELKRKAEQTAAELEEEAQSKTYSSSDWIIVRAFDQGQQILAKASQAAEQEASKIVADSRKDAERIAAEIIWQKEKEADEVKARVLEEFEQLAGVINEAKQRLAHTTKAAEKVTGNSSKQPSGVEARVNRAGEKSEVCEPKVQLQASLTPAEADNIALHQGEMELEVVSPGDFGQMGRFTKRLCNVPNIKLTSLDICVQGKAKATIAITGPTPLTRILREMPIVAEVIEQGNCMKVALKKTDREQHQLLQRASREFPADPVEAENRRLNKAHETLKGRQVELETLLKASQDAVISIPKPEGFIERIQGRLFHAGH